jgi:hypothetical protein
MKKQHDQQLVRIKTLPDSNDDDDTSSSSSSSATNLSEQSSKITNLMRENERKIRNLSESYMNRFLMVNHQLQASNTLALPPPTRAIVSRKSSGMELETMSSSSSPSSSLTLFIETLKYLIIKEEKKRGWNFI